MNLPIYFVNAFTHQVFKGNSAAVIITKTWLTDNKMQLIAKENMLSETAFIVLDENNKYHIRWFSPLTEIDFCGHATLASAYVLFQQAQQLNNPVNTLTFTASAVGDLIVTQKDNGFIEMDFPKRKPEPIIDVPAALFDGLSIKPKEVLRNQQAYFAIYESDYDIAEITTNNNCLKKLAPYDVVVTAPAKLKDNYDFVSRYFWPANGGDEDPVTGSIHTGLVPYWAEKLGKKSLLAYQASERGGHLVCQLANKRVLISGQAVCYLVGQITI